MQLFLGIDIGTSAVKTLLIDERQQQIASHAMPLATSRPAPLWSEQHPDQWWQAVVSCVSKMLPAHLGRGDRVAAVGLSGQMHGGVVLDDHHRPLRPAMLWNDGRAIEEAEFLRTAFPHLAEELGVMPMAGLTAPQLLWLKHHQEELFRRIHLVLSPKDYISWKLTGTVATDYSDAAGTWLLDERQRTWSKKAIEAVGLRQDQLPPLRESTSFAGTLTERSASLLGLSPATPVAVGGGDTPVGAVGLGAIHPGDCVLSLGTSAHIFTTTDRYRPAVKTMLHSFCHALPERWYQMAAMLNGASCLAWFASLTSTSIDELVSRVDICYSGPGDLLFLPYLSGERTPHNDPRARGVFFGLSPATEKTALCQAVLEGVAFSLADGVQCLKQSGIDIAGVALAGGGARSRIWARIIASVLGIPVTRYAGNEVGPALGAARLAMIAAGLGDIREICHTPPIEEVVAPDHRFLPIYQERHRHFQRLYTKLRSAF